MRYKITCDNFNIEQVYKYSTSSLFTDIKVQNFVIFKFVFALLCITIFLLLIDMIVHITIKVQENHL